MIENLVMGKGWTVTQSRLVPHPITGAQVEIDIAIETEHAGIPVLIAIEVQNRNRRADAEWIRLLTGKYKDLPVQKPVLAVSFSGFTSQAIAEARSNGFLPLTLEQVRKGDWIPQFHNVVSMNFEVAGIDWSEPVILAVPPESPDPPHMTVEERRNLVLLTADGRSYGSVAQVREAILSLGHVRRGVDLLLSDRIDSTLGMQIEVLATPRKLIVSYFGDSGHTAGLLVRCRLEEGSYAVGPGESCFPVTGLVMDLKKQTRLTSIPLDHSLYRGIAVASGVGELFCGKEGGKAEVAWVHKKEGDLRKVGVYFDTKGLRFATRPVLEIHYVTPSGEKRIAVIPAELDLAQDDPDTIS